MGNDFEITKNQLHEISSILLLIAQCAIHEIDSQRTGHHRSEEVVHDHVTYMHLSDL